MDYRELRCHTVLQTITKKDTLFHGAYSVDPYQNCEFGCAYCDSSFDTTVYVKTNAPEILDQELAHIKKV